MKLSRVLFYLLCWFVPYNQALRMDIGPLRLSMPYVLTVLGLLAMAAEWASAGVRWEKPTLRVYTPALIFVLVYAGIGIVSVFRIQLDSRFSSHGVICILEQLGRLALSLSVMVFVANQVRSHEDLLRALRIVVISAGVVGIFGIYQVVSTYFGCYREILPNMGSYGVAFTGSGCTRAIGTMKEPSYLAAYLTMTIIVSMLMMVMDGIAVNRFRRWLWVSLGLQGVCLVLTSSTGGFVATGAASLLLMVTLRGRTRKGFILMLIALAILISGPVVYLITTTDLAMKLVQATVDKASSCSGAERSECVRAALSMFFDHPATGVGPGLFGVYLDSYSHMFDTYRFQWVPNNVYAELLGETGVFGFGAFMVMFVGVFVSGLQRMKRSETYYPLVAGLVMVLVSSAIQFVAYPTFKMEFMWFMWGALTAPLEVGSRSGTPQANPANAASAEPSVAV